MRIKLFTHTDLDGIGCAILGKLAFDDIDIEYCNYDDVNKKVKDFILHKQYDYYDHIYITDLSINKEVVELIENTQPDTFKSSFYLNECFSLIDHHPTALWLNKYFWANVEEETILLHFNDETEIKEKVSGTYLFFMELLSNNYLTPSKHEYLILKEFVDIVRKYDTWLWKEKYNDIIPKQWNDLFYILGRDRFIEETLYKIQIRDLEFSHTDTLLLELEQEKINKYIDDKSKRIAITNIQGYAVGVVFAEQYHSELGNRLSGKYQGLDFIVIINMDKSISYRTVKDYVHLGNDVAKIYGGGGHAKAAGSPISNEIREVLINMLFNQDKDGLK